MKDKKGGKTVGYDISHIKPKEINSETSGKYIGAEWTGGDSMTPEFGKLKKGKIYPLKEERATPNSGFKPVYKE